MNDRLAALCLSVTDVSNNITLMKASFWENEKKKNLALLVEDNDDT
jgi:hypothetical protein